ncbi:dopamine receptor D4 [Mycobacterium sp. DL592]|uniref:dopamine receptor D4 n=1 Tax=Mycobacterium sp. DL592 TaxID=2675524 RepID=UPI001FB8AE8B|nr:dopamine receptor D4 [Mycobacterium sp. DL592]
MAITMNTTVHSWAPVRRACLGVAALGAGLAVLSAPTALADPAEPAPAPVVPVDATTQAVSAEPTQLADGVPHLPSPGNLPPGTTDTPPQTRNMGYLREIWHAIQTQDVTMGDALLLLAQRPMTASAGPGQSSAPSGPIGSSAAAPVDAAPAAPTP